MNLPNINNADFFDMNVFVRVSMDVPLKNGQIVDDTRLKSSLKTLQTLREKEAKRIIIAGHLGRPEGHFDGNLSSKNVIEWYKQNLNEDVYYIPFLAEPETAETYSNFVQSASHRFYLLENLRFWKEERENYENFAKNLAGLADCYVNECFDNSHRKHASMISVPKYSKKSYFGESFLNEYTHLNKILDNPQRPLVLILSGIKEDKLSYLDPFIKLADKVLIAGRLPDYLGEDYKNPKAIKANLIQDKEDITLHSIEAFESEISKAGTIVVSGPVGKFEEEGHRQGTERVFNAVVSNKKAFKLAGGGDTGAAIDLLGLRDKFDWVSIAGGAMLDFLADGSLPGIDAVINN